MWISLNTDESHYGNSVLCSDLWGFGLTGFGLARIHCILSVSYGMDKTSIMMPVPGGNYSAFADHSFRIGATTLVARAGVPSPSSRCWAAGSQTHACTCVYALHPDAKRNFGQSLLWIAQSLCCLPPKGLYYTLSEIARNFQCGEVQVMSCAIIRLTSWGDMLPEVIGTPAQKQRR